MSEHLTIDRGDIVTEPRRLRLVASNDWPDQSDTDIYERRRIPAWAYMLCAAAGGFFGTLGYFWLGGS